MAQALDIASLLASLDHYPDYFPTAQLIGTIAAAAIVSGVLFWSQSKKPYVDNGKLKPLTWIEHIFAIGLAISFIANMYYKAAMGFKYVSFMLFPCHVNTLVYIYVFYGTNYRRAYQCFNIVVFYTQFQTLALLLPDTSDVVFPFQVQVYWIHHILLFLAPFLVVFTNRFQVDRSAYHWFFRAVATGLIFAYCIQLPVAMMLRVNVNYTLWPPPGFTDGHLISGADYHMWMTIMLVLTAWVAGYPMMKLAHYLALAFSPYLPAKTMKAARALQSPPTKRSTSTKR